MLIVVVSQLCDHGEEERICYPGKYCLKMKKIAVRLLIVFVITMMRLMIIMRIIFNVHHGLQGLFGIMLFHAEPREQMKILILSSTVWK